MAEPREFQIDVTRIGYSGRTLKIIATTYEEAEKRALEEAGNYAFKEYTSEYRLTWTDPKPGGELDPGRLRDALNAMQKVINQAVFKKRIGKGIAETLTDIREKALGI